MHALFADWFLVVDPSASSDVKMKRWAATEELVSALGATEIVEFAAFIARRSTAPPRLIDTLKRHDETMATRDVEEGLRVLAAITLRLIVEGGSEVAVVAALSLLTSSFAQKDGPQWIEEHVRASATFLSQTGRRLRTPSGSLRVTAADVDAINVVLASASASIDAIAESNDVLWWTFTKHSGSLETPYAMLPQPTVVLAAPIDVFAYVRRIPVAPESETLLLHLILDAVGSGEQEFSFKNYFSSLGLAHAKRLNRQLPVPAALLCPIHTAIAGVVSGKAWMSAFEKSFGIKTVSVLSVQEVAVQLLRELSLVKALSA